MGLFFCRIMVSLIRAFLLPVPPRCFSGSVLRGSPYSPCHTVGTLCRAGFCGSSPRLPWFPKVPVCWFTVLSLRPCAGRHGLWAASRTGRPGLYGVCAACIYNFYIAKVCICLVMPHPGYVPRPPPAGGSPPGGASPPRSRHGHCARRRTGMSIPGC